MKEKIEAGRRVAARLFPAENTIDEALLANAALVIATITARREMQAPCGINQELLAELTAAGNLLIEARKATVRAHARIVRIRSAEGMEELPFGCERPCLMDDKPAQSHLQVAN